MKKTTMLKTTTIKFALLAIFAGLFLTASAQAAIYTVNTANDPGDGVCDLSECTLREAITAANATADNDVINFDASLAGQTIILNGTQLTIAANGTLTINGLGADQLSVSGNMQSRVFYVNEEAKATINGITVTNGKVFGNGFVGFGGGIINLGTLMISNSVINGNSAILGGGIFSNEPLTINNSTISFNSAVESGGGLYLFSGTLTMTKSTISNNSVTNGNGSGGGITNISGIATLINSTISGNQASFGGGSINSFRGGSEMYFINTTVSNNSASIQGGGVYQGGQVSSGNSIFADNTSPNAADFAGFVFSQGYNLFETAPTSGGNIPTDLVGVDPMLGPLQDNGGATFTHALLMGSPAIDAGNSALPTDQRGFMRPVDIPSYPNAANGSDIGAFEYQGSSPTTKDQCKNGGWMTFNFPHTFKNQGDCIQFVNTGK